MLMDPDTVSSKAVPRYPVDEKKLGYHNSVEFVTWLLHASFLLTVREKSIAVCLIVVLV